MVIDLKIEGMSCQNCVRHATRAILAVDGVISAEVILDPGSAKIEATSADSAAIIAALEEEGYPAALSS